MKKLKIKLAAAMMALAMVAGSFAGGAATANVKTVSAASSISASKAKKIALRKSSTASSKAVAMDTYKTYNGSNKYRHYVYDISSRNGSIVKQNSKDYSIISASRAKEIALDDSDVDSSDAKDKEADLDEEDGKLVWNVSFTKKSSTKYYDYWTGYYYTDSDDSDYEYTINAVTGHIIDSDDDDDDD